MVNTSCAATCAGSVTGSSVRIRSCVRDVVVLKLCLLAIQSLKKNYDAVGQAAVALGGLAKLRDEYKKVSFKALKKAAWTTAESGSVVGLLLSLGTCRSKDDPFRQDAVAVSITRGADGKTVYACSGPEACHGPAGCTFDKDVQFSLSEIRSAMAVTMRELFAVLSSTVRPAGLERGTAVSYSKNLSLVRAGGGSWPFVVLRKGAAGKWVCLSCVTASPLLLLAARANFGVACRVLCWPVSTTSLWDQKMGAQTLKSLTMRPQWTMRRSRTAQALWRVPTLPQVMGTKRQTVRLPPSGR